MPTSLRLPEELESDLQALAEKHERSLHSEMLYALKQYVFREKVPYEVDSLYTQSAEKQIYGVYCNGRKIASVQADSANHACDWICATRWISRLKLSATDPTARETLS